MSARKQIPQPRRSSAPPGVRPDPDRPRCSGYSRAGKPCGATPTTSSNGRYCPNHDPQFSPEQRRSWRVRGALAKNHRTVSQARAQVAREVAAVAPSLPAGVELPPVPAETLDWSDASKIRVYLQGLAVKVAAGEIPVSVAKTLKELCDSTLRVVDVELDMALAKKLTEDEA
jgi:hypothetical protein